MITKQVTIQFYETVPLLNSLFNWTFVVHAPVSTELPSQGTSLRPWRQELKSSKPTNFDLYAAASVAVVPNSSLQCHVVSNDAVIIGARVNTVNSLQRIEKSVARVL
jgi:hypothetical protein